MEEEPPLPCGMPRAGGTPSPIGIPRPIRPTKGKASPGGANPKGACKLIHLEASQMHRSWPSATCDPLQS